MDTPTKKQTAQHRKMADTVATDDTPSRNSSLKRLDFVQKTVGTVYTAAVDTAAKARSLTPTIVEPYVAKVEASATQLLSPVVIPVLNRAQDAGEQALHALDDKVGCAVCPRATTPLPLSPLLTVPARLSPHSSLLF